MEKKIHVKKLNLGNGVIIENDKIKQCLPESQNDDVLELNDAFAEIISMAEKIDEYYEQNDI